nr:hypothetical protein Iba_chr13eCG10710 [Ipomoea batatas]
MDVRQRTSDPRRRGNNLWITAGIPKVSPLPNPTLPPPGLELLWPLTLRFPKAIANRLRLMVEAAGGPRRLLVNGVMARVEAEPLLAVGIPRKVTGFQTSKHKGRKW